MNNEIENNMVQITKFEVENALSKLLFYVQASINYKPYSKFKVLFENILKIVKKWIEYYVEDNNLLRMTDSEVDEINKYLNQVSFDAYNGDFYEEVDTWLSVVIYYGSCPIDKEFDETLIKRKGNDLNKK